MREAKNPDLWTYLSVALKEYDIPRSRLEEAIDSGRIKTKEVKNPHYRSGPSSRLVYRPDLVGILPELQRNAGEKVLREKRAQVARQVTEERRAKILRWVEELKVEVERFPDRDALTREAVEHYNCLWQDRGRDDKFADVNADPAFLERITVNFLRHEGTQYEERLVDIWGKVGAEEARERVKIRVLEAIGKAYPHLAEECVRQDPRVREQLPPPRDPPKLTEGKGPLDKWA